MTAAAKKVIVRGFSKALPTRLVTNDDLAQWMDTSDEWIRQRTGIQTRYWIEPPTTTSDLGVQASESTFSAIGTRDVQAVVAATLSPDFGFPGIGVQIQSKLKLDKVPAYDLRNQCSGFVYGLEMSAALIRSGVYERILLVGAEVHSTGLDVSTRGRDLAVLFGDGAGACVLESEEAAGATKDGAFEFLGSELHADGDHVEELWCKDPGSYRHPVRLTAEMVENGEIFPSMNGRVVFMHATKRMAEVSASLLAKNKLGPQDVDLLVPHQANIRINQAVADQLQIPQKRVFHTIQKYGNTTAATIPIGMFDALAEGKVKSGDVIVNSAFGSGFTWGATLLRAL